MSFSSEEIAKIHVVINSGDIPDFSEKMRDAAKSVSQLQEEIQQTQKDLGILAARGDQNSENFKIMQKHLSTLQTRLKNTNKEMKYYTESIDINLMSSNQLNARSKVLTNTLNALSKEAEPGCLQSVKDTKFESNSQLNGSISTQRGGCLQSVKDTKFESNSQQSLQTLKFCLSCLQSVKDTKFESNSQLTWDYFLPILAIVYSSNILESLL